MGTRRISRERALQALFYADASYSDRTTTLSLFCKYFLPEKQAEHFFQRLIAGVWQHEHDIDTIIEKHSSNWKMHRMTCVDRNILRFAVFELLYCLDIPNRVSINEAVDLGKKFGTEESGAFINGILDSIHINMNKSCSEKSHTQILEVTN